MTVARPINTATVAGCRNWMAKMREAERMKIVGPSSVTVSESCFMVTLKYGGALFSVGRDSVTRDWVLSRSAWVRDVAIVVGGGFSDMERFE